jgi:putative mycofactocin binding protein MftB
MAFDLDRRYELDPQVAIRPESFGGLAYHYGNRRLTFLKAQSLVDLVRSLADHATARLAVEERIPAARRAAHEDALAELLESGVIRGG